MAGKGSLKLPRHNSGTEWQRKSHGSPVNTGGPPAVASLTLEGIRNAPRLSTQNGAGMAKVQLNPEKRQAPKK